MRVPFQLFLILALLMVSVSGCGSGGLLSEVRVDPPQISPNEKQLQPATNIHYKISRRSDVSITLIDSSGKTYPLRQKQTRQADEYNVNFRGAVAPESNSELRRVLPDGTYTVRIEVFPPGSAAGTAPEAVQEVQLRIKDANTQPPVISPITVEKKQITPNGDGEDDETRIGFSVSVSSTVTVRAVNKATNHVYLLQEPKKIAGESGFRFDGNEIGGSLMPDGDYYFTVRAEDRSGNVSEQSADISINRGGYPQLRLMKVSVDPPAIAYGGIVTVTAVIKNVGNAPVRTLGPSSGELYSTNETYGRDKTTDKNGQLNAKYYERNGRWRLAITYTNAGTRFPLRWSLIKGTDAEIEAFELYPDQEVTVVAPIRVEEGVEDLYFTVAIERGGVGFFQDRVMPPIIVSGFPK